MMKKALLLASVMVFAASAMTYAADSTTPASTPVKVTAEKAQECKKPPKIQNLKNVRLNSTND